MMPGWIASFFNFLNRPIILVPAIFVLGGFLTPIFEQIVSKTFQSYSQVRSAPNAIICAPLQESRLIVRSGDEIIHEVEYGFPNETLTVFRAGASMLENVEILLYPLSHHGRRPVIYTSNVQTSDRMAAGDSVVEVDGASISLRMPFLKAQEVVYIDVLYGQPVSILMEVRADNYSARFTGVAGCANAPRSISSPPTVSIFEYFWAACGDSGDEPCGIPATPEGGLEFNVSDDGVPPTFEEVIIWGNERISRMPQE